jgi:hypothetical protein
MARPPTASLGRACVLALALLVGCGKLSAPREIASTTASGCIDLVFYMDRHEVLQDGTQSFTARGLHEGRPVAFDLELTPWRENPPGYVNMTTWECGAKLISKGDAGNELLRAMDALYGTRTSPESMVKEVSCLLVSPWKDPGNFEERGAKMVAQFQMHFDMDVAPELWIDVHPERKRIALRERDPRLRLAVIKALTQREELEGP